MLGDNKDKEKQRSTFLKKALTKEERFDIIVKHLKRGSKFTTENV